MSRDPESVSRTQMLWGFLAPPESGGELGRLGSYRVLKMLGEGGMGIVFKAEDVNLHRLVALKVMRPEISAQQRAKVRFLREARATAALKHDNVVTIYQVGEDRGVPFLAMEFLTGKSLEDWLRPDRRASISEAVGVAKQTARGLVAAHAAGLIHRDIKPANIWIELPKGRIKILDFGLARLVEGDFPALTMDGAAVGTPAFMAPEQARGETADHRSDLFSFGCVLYRMVTGRLPFQGNSICAVLTAIASETPPLASALNPSVPLRLQELISKLLAKSPTDRPESMQAVLDELQEIEQTLKTSPEVPAPVNSPNVAALAPTIEWNQSPRASTRRKWIAAAIGVVALISIGLFTAWSKLAKTATPSAPDQTVFATITTAANPSPSNPQSSDSPPSKSIDLLKLVKTQRDIVQGEWVLTKEGELIGSSTEPGGNYSIILPWDPPQEYRLKATVFRRRPSGSNFSIGLASGTGRLIFAMDVPHDNQLHSGIDGPRRGLFADGTILWKGRLLRMGTPEEIVFTVQKGGLMVTVNEKTIYDVSRDNERSRRPAGVPPQPLVLVGHEGSFSVKNVILEPLGDSNGSPLGGSSP